CTQADAIEVEPSLGRSRGFHPRLKAFLAELRESWRGLLLSDPNLTLGQAGTVRRFHLASQIFVALLRGLANELALPHEFVPVHATGTTCATFAAGTIRAFLVTSSLVDHFLPRFCLPLPLGRPPSLPFSREVLALRFDRTEPRQAGQ